MSDALVYTIPRSKTDVVMSFSVGSVAPVDSLVGGPVGTLDGGPVDALECGPVGVFDDSPDGTVDGAIVGCPVGSVGVVLIAWPTAECFRNKEERVLDRLHPFFTIMVRCLFFAGCVWGTLGATSVEIPSGAPSDLNFIDVCCCVTCCRRVM
jgi:hypothetical protein